MKIEVTTNLDEGRPVYIATVSREDGLIMTADTRDCQPINTSAQRACEKLVYEMEEQLKQVRKEFEKAGLISRPEKPR